MDYFAANYHVYDINILNCIQPVPSLGGDNGGPSSMSTVKAKRKACYMSYLLCCINLSGMFCCKIVVYGLYLAVNFRWEIEEPKRMLNATLEVPKLWCHQLLSNLKLILKPLQWVSQVGSICFPNSLRARFYNLSILLLHTSNRLMALSRRLNIGCGSEFCLELLLHCVA